ncbi:hypothetical protein MMC07_003593 [Pseudocyphellaria aurata]|nr:hypothetical protein [Pseudocyphellaria aurata]
MFTPSHFSSSHSPAQGWSYRVPSPPRIVIPPPVLNASGLPDLHIDQDSSLSVENNGFGKAEFLKTVTYDNFIVNNSYIEWRYEQRRLAQQVLPFMYLGPVSAARDLDFLQNSRITMVLAVRNTMSAQARLLESKAATDLGLEIQTLDVAGNQELIAAFPRGIEIVNAHLSAMYKAQQSKLLEGAMSGKSPSSPPGKVLVYCESGNERSACFVAAYIMAMYSMQLLKTIQIVQSQRFCVSFDDPSKILLQTYEAILQAKRDVFQADGDSAHVKAGPVNDIEPHRRPAALKLKASKRTLDEAYEDDMDVDGDERKDGNESEAREGSAPFLF